MIDGFDGSLPFCLETMLRHIGKTVTIFTTSGGLSGDGFTGVLVGADVNCVRLICDIGMAPACCLGSSCGPRGGFGFGNFGGFGGCSSGNCGLSGSFFGGNPFGSVTVIPTRHIAAFVHNAI